MIPAGQLVVSEQELRSVHDRLYRLESAVEDVQADLAGDVGPEEYKQAVEHLLDAAQDLVGVVIEPVRQ
jgi:tetrahydromethanopterin S-methyltransferase subunit G